MILLNSDKNLILKFDELISVNVHTDGKRIMATCLNPMIKDQIIATYSNKEKCKRAFGFFITALKNDVDFFEFPNEYDERLNTSLRTNDGFRTNRTNGKTK